ncbi:MAG: hypothetical protein IT389_15340 [Nitrospira sp.]|nr:hypothetical protein [Nitrospira sp.]
MHSIRNNRIRYTATGLFLTAALVSGCSMFSGSQSMHQSAKGSVYLEEVSEWSFEANHPTIIDQNTMLKIVKGITTEEAVSASSRMPASGSKPMRVFSDGDAEFLAPLLAQGLSRAKPEQIVGFRVSSSAGSGAAPTAGTLYVQHGAAYFTISSIKGIKTVGFAPKSAAHIESAPSFAANGAAGALSMVIDYAALARASMPAAMPVATVMPSTPIAQAPSGVSVKAARQSSPASASTVAIKNPSASEDKSTNDMTTEDILNMKLDELRQAQEANALKESEISILRKETEWMKKELRERTAERDAMKAKNVSSKPAPKKKSAELQPTR